MTVTVFCMSATTFTDSGALDENGLRRHLGWLASEGIGIYLGSGGAGEGHALTNDERKRLYEIGVEQAGGVVPVYANPPESRTADEMYAKARIAVEAGVDCVQLYAVDGGHGMVPTPSEQEGYYRSLLDEIDHPVAISIHAYQGYLTPVPLLRMLAEEYPQLIAMNVMGVTLRYLVELKDALRPGIAYYTSGYDMLAGYGLGASGCLSAEPNLAPRLCKHLAECCERGDLAGAGQVQASWLRVGATVSRWAPSTARWVKMGLKVSGRGNGVLRPPYLLPPESELEEMARALDALGVPELMG